LRDEYSALFIKVDGSIDGPKSMACERKKISSNQLHVECGRETNPKFEKWLPRLHHIPWKRDKISLFFTIHMLLI